jgi:hypothetical protein
VKISRPSCTNKAIVRDGPVVFRRPWNNHVALRYPHKRIDNPQPTLVQILLDERASGAYRHIFLRHENV